jgi:hypothetical protein
MGPNGGQFRAISGNFGVMLYTDGTYAYLLQTASGAPTGPINAYRPFYWTLSNGAVGIDATGVGITTGGALVIGGAVSSGGAALFNGTINSYGNIIANSGKLRASVGAFGSGDGNAATILNDFVFTYTGIDAGYTRLPNGLIDQVANAIIPCGGGLQTTLVTLPIAFPNSCLDAIVCFPGSNPPGSNNPGSISVAPYSTTQVAVTTNYALTGTLGVVVRARGN